MVVQKAGAVFTCAAFALGLQLFGDSLGRVWLFEQMSHHSTISILVPPEGSEWYSRGADAVEQFQADAGNREVVALATFGRGFAAATKGGYVAVCGMRRTGCTPALLLLAVPASS